LTSDRFGATCAVAFVVLFLAGLALLDLPGHDDNELLLNEFYGQTNSRLRVIFGSYSLAFAGLAFLGLGAALCTRAERSGAPATLTKLTLLSCAVAAVLLIGAAAAQVPTYAGSIDAFDEPTSELTRATIPHIGYSLLLFSLLASAAFVATVSTAVRLTGMLPRWTSWVGYICAGLLLLSILFMPMVALPIWALAIGAALWRAPKLVHA
jgi:hypothetical protein